MKKKISITLSADLRLQIDKQIGPSGSGSAFIEKVLGERLRKLAREEIGERDLILINATGDRLNAEMEDVLRDQGDALDALAPQK